MRGEWRSSFRSDVQGLAQKENVCVLFYGMAVSISRLKPERRRVMPNRAVAIAACLLLTATVFAKDKKHALPAYVLTARTVTVIIDPEAGMSVEDPRANQIARKDVETALLNWGRFDVRMDGQGTDLVIVIRKGYGRAVEPTISNPRQNNPAGSIDPYDDGIGIGAQHGRAPDSAVPNSAGQTPHPEIEAGSTLDTFTVYRGDIEKPLDAPAAWRYSASDALQSPSVPAVEKFRKAIADAEKAAAKGP